MTTVVKSSSSVYSTYISTVDHLPCDIVRSLWLVQACNIAADSEKRQLGEFLNTCQYNNVHAHSNRYEILRACRESQSRILSWNKEALAELESLGKQMEAHEKMLLRGVMLLHRTVTSPFSLDQHSQSEVLKKQLDAHYREHPLASQVEALQERVLNGQHNVIIKHTPGSASGVKIILKIPRERVSEIASSGPISVPAVEKDESAPKVEAAAPVKGKRGRPRKVVTLAPEAVPEKHVDILPTVPSKPVVVEPTTEVDSAKEVAPEKPSSVADETDPPESYCVCHQPSFGDMIACDYAKCTNGEWFHYKCVGLLNRAEVANYKTQKWYCSDTCKTGAESSKPRKKRRRAKW